MGQVYAFSKLRRRRAGLLRRARDAAIVFTIVFVLAQPEVRRHVGTTAEALGAAASGAAIECTTARVIDGDTLDCAGVRVRLAGIDTPEMPGHCRAGRRCVEGDPHAARAALRALASLGLTCRPEATDAYGRTIARCDAAGRDVSCALIAEGHAERR
ncbi:MAG: thermonuclease family protein [Oceanicaulis sp.]